MIYMEKIYGTIIEINASERTFIIQTKQRKMRLYMQRAMYNKLGKYLAPNHRIYCVIETPKQFKSEKRYVIHHIQMIKQVSSQRPVVLFNQKNIEIETKQLINQLQYTMFLDLEMSMHPYRVDKSFVQEIIQVGYILTDVHNQVVERYQTYIQPTVHKTLTKRTLKFLDLTQDNVDSGITFQEFYHHFNNVIKRFKPAIIVWGKNDQIGLKDACKINQLPGLNRNTRFINLLQLHKNVFILKDDLGLMNAYALYEPPIQKNQRHDAYEDAKMTRKIFEGFKSVLNQKRIISTDHLI